jgi:hypothetical protein
VLPPEPFGRLLLVNINYVHTSTGPTKAKTQRSLVATQSSLFTKFVVLGLQSSAHLHRGKGKGYTKNENQEGSVRLSVQHQQASFLICSGLLTYLEVCCTVDDVAKGSARLTV